MVEQSDFQSAPSYLTADVIKVAKAWSKGGLLSLSDIIACYSEEQPLFSSEDSTYELLLQFNNMLFKLLVHDRLCVLRQMLCK